MRLIDADALCAYLNEWSRKLHAGVYHNDAIIMDVLTSVFEYIANMPTIDAEPVRHGYWIGLEYDGYADGCPVYDLWECSECGNEHKGRRHAELLPRLRREDGSGGRRMNCDYCTHVRYSADGGSTYCGRSGKYKGFCRFNPDLAKCPQCGSRVKLVRIWEDSYIIAPKDNDGCIYCRNFTDKPSTKENVTQEWDNEVERIRRGWSEVQNV